MTAASIACEGGEVEEARPEPPGSDATVDVFLEAHWGARPIDPQGPPPDWPEVETDLSPIACASCHAEQFQDWSTALHSKAFSPGLEGQLVTWFDGAPGTVRQCMTCHGPLSEQLRSVSGGDGRWRRNPDYYASLERAGVVCAACHVRGWRRYGPPLRDGTVPAPRDTSHQGVVRHTAFEESRFCAPCHQFGPGAAAPNGKPLENTVAEWEATTYAEEGVTCQQCHMPERRHLWRGIHDPEMTRSGVTPEWTVSGDPGSPDFAVRLSLTNTGTGHHFPTYVTPAVDLEIRFMDSDLDTLGVRTFVVQRVAVYEGGRWVERRDDRIPAGETKSVAWEGPAPTGATRVAGRVRVRPDAFYHEFFVNFLRNAPEGSESKALIEEALRMTDESPFDLWTWETPLPASGPAPGADR